MDAKNALFGYGVLISLWTLSCYIEAFIGAWYLSCEVQPAQSFQSFREDFTAEEVLLWATEAFGDGLVLQSSGGIQSAVMLQLATSIKPDIKVVFVDTGYLPKETRNHMEVLRKEFNLNLIIARPQLTPLEIELQHGKLWETDHELYGEITKVEPMNRVLNELNCTAILSGLRREQTPNRAELKMLSYDMSNHRLKVLPILEWTSADVKTYKMENMLPRHSLESCGFATVGDNHSSRALKAGESEERATRFGGKAQECGLHTKTVGLEFPFQQKKETRATEKTIPSFGKES